DDIGPAFPIDQVGDGDEPATKGIRGGRVERVCVVRTVSSFDMGPGRNGNRRFHVCCRRRVFVWSVSVAVVQITQLRRELVEGAAVTAEIELADEVVPVRRQ